MNRIPYLPRCNHNIVIVLICGALIYLSIVWTCFIGRMFFGKNGNFKTTKRLTRSSGGHFVQSQAAEDDNKQESDAEMEYGDTEGTEDPDRDEAVAVTPEKSKKNNEEETADNEGLTEKKPKRSSEDAASDDSDNGEEQFVAAAAAKKKKTSGSKSDDDSDDDVKGPPKVGRFKSEPIDLVDTDDEDMKPAASKTKITYKKSKPKEEKAEEETEPLALDFIRDEDVTEIDRKQYDHSLVIAMVLGIVGVLDYAYIIFENTKQPDKPSYAPVALTRADKDPNWRLHPKFHIQPAKEAKDRFKNNKRIEYDMTSKTDGSKLGQTMHVLRIKNFSKARDEHVKQVGDVICKHLYKDDTFYSKSIGMEGNCIWRNLSHCDLIGEEEAMEECRNNHIDEFNRTWGQDNPQKLRAYFKEGQLPAAFAMELGAPVEWIKSGEQRAYTDRLERVRARREQRERRRNQEEA